jgi:hypothetical protein
LYQANGQKEAIYCDEQQLVCHMVFLQKTERNWENTNKTSDMTEQTDDDRQMKFPLYLARAGQLIDKNN